MTAVKTKTFDGRWAAEVFELEDGRSDCHILDTKTKAGGSLALADGTGMLTGDGGYGEDVPIPAGVVSRIEAWALAHGY